MESGSFNGEDREYDGVRFAEISNYFQCRPTSIFPAIGEISFFVHVIYSSAGPHIQQCQSIGEKQHRRTG